MVLMKSQMNEIIGNHVGNHHHPSSPPQQQDNQQNQDQSHPSNTHNDNLEHQQRHLSQPEDDELILVRFANNTVEMEWKKLKRLVQNVNNQNQNKLTQVDHRDPVHSNRNKRKRTYQYEMFPGIRQQWFKFIEYILNENYRLLDKEIKTFILKVDNANHDNGDHHDDIESEDDIHVKKANFEKFIKGCTYYGIILDINNKNHEHIIKIFITEILCVINYQILKAYRAEHSKKTRHIKDPYKHWEPDQCNDVNLNLLYSQHHEDSDSVAKDDTKVCYLCHKRYNKTGTCSFEKHKKYCVVKSGVLCPSYPFTQNEHHQYLLLVDKHNLDIDISLKEYLIKKQDIVKTIVSDEKTGFVPIEQLIEKFVKLHKGDGPVLLFIIFNHSFIIRSLEQQCFHLGGENYYCHIPQLLNEIKPPNRKHYINKSPLIIVNLSCNNHERFINHNDEWCKFYGVKSYAALQPNVQYIYALEEALDNHKVSNWLKRDDVFKQITKQELNKTNGLMDNSIELMKSLQQEGIESIEWVTGIISHQLPSFDKFNINFIKNSIKNIAIVNNEKTTGNDCNYFKLQQQVVKNFINITFDEHSEYFTYDTFVANLKKRMLDIFDQLQLSITNDKFMRKTKMNKVIQMLYIDLGNHINNEIKNKFPSIQKIKYMDKGNHKDNRKKFGKLKRILTENKLFWHSNHVVNLGLFLLNQQYSTQNDKNNVKKLNHLWVNIHLKPANRKQITNALNDKSINLTRWASKLYDGKSQLVQTKYEYFWMKPNDDIDYQTHILPFYDDPNKYGTIRLDCDEFKGIDCECKIAKKYHLGFNQYPYFIQLILNNNKYFNCIKCIQNKRIKSTKLLGYSKVLKEEKKNNYGQSVIVVKILYAPIVYLMKNKQ